MRYVLIIAILLAVGAAAYNNVDGVRLSILSWSAHLPLAAIIVICFAGGVAAGLLMWMPSLSLLRMHEKLMRIQLDQLEAEAVSKTAERRAVPIERESVQAP